MKRLAFKLSFLVAVLVQVSRSEDVPTVPEDAARARPGALASKERKCVPLLAGLSWPSGNDTGRSMSDEFKFGIKDMDMPLQIRPGGGNPLNSAMKLLSLFEKQIYGDDEQGEEEDDDEEINDDLVDGADSRGEEEPRKNVIRFQQNKLHLSGLNLTMLNVHLYNKSEHRFGIGVSIKNTTLQGRFIYNGPTPTLLVTSQHSVGGSSTGGRARLSGAYRMFIDNMLVVANSNLTKVETTTNRDESLSPLRQFKLVANDFNMNISNLGYISIDILDAHDPSKPTSSYVLRMLQRVLQKTIKRIYYSLENNLKQTLELEGRRFIDCELTRFHPLLTSGGTKVDKQVSLGGAPSDQSPSTSLEDLSRIISSEIDNMHLDRVPLPDFDYQRQIFGSSAKIFFSNGTLSGLSNFRLTGETKVKLQNQHLLVNASLGWFNLRPHYNWTLFLGSTGGATTGGKLIDKIARQADSTASEDTPTSVGFVAFNIKAIEFDAVISRGLVSSSKIFIDELAIRRLDGPKMEFGGLPGMNRLARGLVNFFMGRLKQRLVSSIQPALKRELEIVLNRLPLLNH